MKKIFFINKELFKWLWRGKWYIMTLITLLITILYILKIISSCSSVVSTTFSVVGLLILLFQLFLDAKQFKVHRPNTLGNWLNSFPKPRTIILEVDSGHQVVTGEKASLIVSLPDNATIERKIEFLIQQYKNLQSSLTILDDNFDDFKSSQIKTGAEMIKDLEEMRNTLESTLAGHVVGSYDLVFFAIFLTILGTLIQAFC